MLLPGQRIELTEPWADSPQLDWVTVKVAAGASAYPDLNSESETDFLAVPWLAAGLALLLTAAGIAFAVLRRRRNAGPQQAEPVPDLARTS